MNIIELTQHDGRQVFINADQIQYIEPYDGQTHVEYPTAETRIETSHFCFYVKEDVHEVINLIYLEEEEGYEVIKLINQEENT